MLITTPPQWQICSETCLTLFLPTPITLEQQQYCWGLADSIEQFDEVAEVVVGMNTISVYTHPLTSEQLFALQAKLQQFCEQNSTPKAIQGKHVEIPVRYGGEFGPDLVSASTLCNLSVTELVKAHTEPVYTVYFIGFQAGFPYLGGLPERLHMPRHATPRTQVPAGSVGIGGQQTGIYPFSSPGGWQLLGRTDLPLFDLAKNPPTLLQAGDTLSFVAVEVIEE